MKPASVRRRLVAGTAGVVALATVVSGCGGSKSDPDQVKSTVSSFFTAVGEGKGQAACAFLDSSGEHEVTTAAYLLKPPASCAEAINDFNKVLSSDDKKSLKSTKVKKVVVTGTTATVADADIELKTGGEIGLFRNSSPKPMTLEKVNGDWKISSLG